MGAGAEWAIWGPARRTCPGQDLQIFDNLEEIPAIDCRRLLRTPRTADLSLLEGRPNGTADQDTKQDAIEG